MEAINAAGRACQPLCVFTWLRACARACLREGVACVRPLAVCVLTVDGVGPSCFVRGVSWVFDLQPLFHCLLFVSFLTLSPDMWFKDKRRPMRCLGTRKH